MCRAVQAALDAHAGTLYADEQLRYALIGVIVVAVAGNDGLIRQQEGQDMTIRRRCAIGALVGLGLLVAGCSDGDGNGHDKSDDNIDTHGWTSKSVIETFAKDNVPAEYVGSMTEFEPKYAEDASTFHASWFDFGSGSILIYGGRVLVFDDLTLLREIESYYDEDDGSTWVFTNEACGVLVQLNGEMTAYWAHRYGEVVENIC
ncbi:MAG: hypothetical protein ACRDPQ_02165 [Nocardioidaceae bacterium]